MMLFSKVFRLIFLPDFILEKELVTDLKPVMQSTGGFILEKVEGLAITSDGQAWISTDNDGTGKKSTGETLFLNIGKI